MIVRLPMLLVAAAALVTPSLAAADPIAIASIPIIGFASSPPPSTAGFELVVHGAIHLFHHVPITDATVGQTLIANTSTDSQFAAFARFATNGLANITHFDFGPFDHPDAAETGANSEGLLFRLPSPAVDFRGFTLSSVQLQVNEFSLTTINEIPVRKLSGELSVFGEGAFNTTPEPASVLLLLIGALAVGVRQWRAAQA